MTLSVGKEGKTMKEIRIPWFGKYLIWNKGLWFGDDTSTEDLWHSGYEFHMGKILGFKFLIAEKRFK